MLFTHIYLMQGKNTETWFVSRGIQKVLLLKFPNFDPPPSCLPLFVFKQHPHSPTPNPFPQGLFNLAGTHPVPFNFYTCQI